MAISGNWTGKWESLSRTWTPADANCINEFASIECKPNRSWFSWDQCISPTYVIVLVRISDVSDVHSCAYFRQVQLVSAVGVLAKTKTSGYLTWPYLLPPGLQLCDSDIYICVQWLPERMVKVVAVWIWMRGRSLYTSSKSWAPIVVWYSDM